MKKALLVVCLLFTVSTASAQISRIYFGAGLSFAKLFGGSGLSAFIGPGINGGVSLGQKMSIGGYFNYGFGGSYESAVVGYDERSGTPPYASQTLTGSYSTRMMDIGVDWRFNFVGKVVAKVQWFGVFGASASLLRLGEIELDNPNHGLTVDQAYLEATNYSQLYINAGTGLEVSLGKVQLIGDLRLRLPANQVNGQYVSISMPAGFAFGIGARYSIFK